MFPFDLNFSPQRQTITENHYHFKSSHFILSLAEIHKNKKRNFFIFDIQKKFRFILFNCILDWTELNDIDVVDIVECDVLTGNVDVMM